MKMAAGSERSPPPFPDSEDQDPEHELGEDEDSDEGADIFTGAVSTTPLVCLGSTRKPVSPR